MQTTIQVGAEACRRFDITFKVVNHELVYILRPSSTGPSDAPAYSQQNVQ